MTESTPEHVFPRSVGGGLVIPVHQGCNDHANRKIDNFLVQCGHVQWARADVGIRTPRGVPYREKLLGTTKLMVRPANSPDDSRDLATAFGDGEAIGGAGVRMQFSISKGEVTHVRVLPNPIPHPEGGLQSFTSEDLDTSLVESSQTFEPYEVLLLVQARRECRHPRDMWRRFTAKVALGWLVALRNTDAVFEDGFPARESLTEEGYRRLGQKLRQLAFEDPAADGVAAEPSRVAASDNPTPRHVVGITGKGQGALVVLQLFRYLAYHIHLSGVEVRHVVHTQIDLRDRVS